MKDILSVRELQRDDIDKIINYWMSSDDEFMKGMGVDIAKVPDEKSWREMLSEQLSQDYNEKGSYCIIWMVNDRPVGHSNVNKIVFGEDAYMHLHIWDPEVRKKGYGTEFIKKTLPYFFDNLQLKKLFCEPYALNPAPNKVLEKAGFRFVKNHVTTPGWLNFEQEVSLWEKKWENNTSFRRSGNVKME